MAKCTFQEGAGSPVGVNVPKFIGQLYHDTVADTYYRSTGLTNADWVLIGAAPAVPFVEWLPHTEVATWNDSGGVGQVGDYTAFLANADLPTLSSIDLDGTAITSLVCNDCPLLTNISSSLCTGPLTILDVDGCVALSTLTCSYNSISSIDVSSCHALNRLMCAYNSLTTLNVDGCTALTVLYCFNNSLAALDVSSCTTLQLLNCQYNSLAAMDVSSCALLGDFICSHNQITILNVTGCSVLTNLELNYNLVLVLDVSTCVSLTNLSCIYNQLSALDVSTCNALSALGCNNNQLTTLDVSTCIALTFLFCGYNLLTNGVGGSVNIVLSDMVANNPPVGTIDISNQNPLAPPDAGPPDGATAKATLIGLGWTVTTD